MRKLIRMFLTALAPALIAACMSTGSQNPPQSITLSITPDRLAPGGTATLTLRNGSEETVGYNLCASSLFRQAGADAWEPVPEDRFCTMELRTLPPGEQASFDVQLPADLTPGSYRYQTNVEHMERGARETVATAPFTVAE